mmetsp:Transcript_175335/g.562420  ORF Transcript_175335/g.562420 Transcript_175335/m.562420 type:complete len:462 (+) Transcript_175335:59-1444(+)
MCLCPRPPSPRCSSPLSAREDIQAAKAPPLSSCASSSSSKGGLGEEVPGAGFPRGGAQPTGRHGEALVAKSICRNDTGRLEAHGAALVADLARPAPDHQVVPPPGSERQRPVQVEACMQHPSASRQRDARQHGLVLGLRREALKLDLATLPETAEVDVERDLSIVVVQGELPIPILDRLVLHREGPVRIQPLAMARQQGRRHGLEVVRNQGVEQPGPEGQLGQDHPAAVHRVGCRLRKPRSLKVCQLLLQPLAECHREDVEGEKTGPDLLQQAPRLQLRHALQGRRGSVACSQGGRQLPEGRGQAILRPRGVDLPPERHVEPARGPSARGRLQRRLQTLLPLLPHILQHLLILPDPEFVDLSPVLLQERRVVATVHHVQAQSSDVEVVRHVALAHPSRALVQVVVAANASSNSRSRRTQSVLAISLLARINNGEGHRFFGGAAARACGGSHGKVGGPSAQT